MHLWIFALLGLIGSDEQLKVIYFVRHAEKITEVEDPDLSILGLERVKQLNRLMLDVPFDGVISSEFLRTRRTAEPIAAQHDLDVEVIPASKPEQLISRVKGTGSFLLVVGHSNTIPDLIQRLGCPCDEISETEYDHVFVVVLSGSQCLSHSLKMHIR